MIKYNPKSWLRLIFHRYSKETFKKTLPNMLVLGFYVSVFTILYEFFLTEIFVVTGSVHSLLGIVLGLFLVFRMNSAYDKWWEGRTIWGALVNDSRNLAIKVNAFLGVDKSKERANIASLIGNYSKAMKEHLRDGDVAGAVQMDEESLTALKKWNHKPNKIANDLYQRINEFYKNKDITGEQLFLLDKELKGLTDNIGACERIKNTPIPYAYNMYIKKFIFIYSITLPMGYVSTFHYWTIPVTLFVFYFLVTIELIAEEIEEPFGLDENDLPTDELSEKITANVHEILVERANTSR